MILVFKVLAFIFMLIGINFTVVLIMLAIQGRSERKRTAKYYDFDEDEINNLEIHNKQLDIMSRDLDEYLREKYCIPKVDECDGCMLKDLTGADDNHILTCLKCRRSYVEGSDEREEYSDNYIAEEEE